MKYANLPPTKQIGNYQWNHQALLGQGSYGKVYLGHENSKSGQIFAIKVMQNTDFNNPQMKEALHNELNILKTLQGVPFTLGLIDHLQTASNQYIIQKFCNGGDFRSVLNKKGKLPEEEAIKAFSEMLNGMKELVNRKIIHRDLKPENTLIHDNICNIADFGFSAFIQNFDNEKMTFFVGTPLYMSPQIMKNQPYTTKCDIWSLGMIYYEMLYGQTPFPCNSIEQLQQNTFTMPITFPNYVKVSQQSKDLIKGCLQLDENKRLTWNQLLNHPLFQTKQLNYQPQVNLDNKSSLIIKKLQNVIVQHNINVQELFKKFDQSGDAQLDANEFSQLILKIDPNLNQQELFSIFKQFDVSGDGKISFNEFKSLALETSYQDPSQQQQNLEQNNKMLLDMKAKAVIKQIRYFIERDNIDLALLFQKFDTSGDKKLDENEFGQILKAIDPQITPQEIHFIFWKFDQDHSGSISLSEFQISIGLTSQNIQHEMQEKAKKQCPPSQFQQSVESKLSNNGRVIVNKLKMIIKDNNLDNQLVYKQFDKDKSGSIDIKEFAALCQTYINRLKIQEVQEIFKAIDKDNSNQISFSEFDQFFEKPNVWKELAAKLPTDTSPEDEKQRKQLFNLFDPNHNGYLSLAEVDKGIKDVLDCEALYRCKRAIARAFHAAKNANKKNKAQGKNYIEYDEFRLLLIYLRQYFEYHVMFEKIDKGQDHRIDYNEFCNAINMIQSWGIKINNPQAEFQKIDRNGGGQILFDEFAFWAINKKLDLPEDDDFYFDESQLANKFNFCNMNMK